MIQPTREGQGLPRSAKGLIRVAQKPDGRSVSGFPRGSGNAKTDGLDGLTAAVRRVSSAEVSGDQIAYRQARADPAHALRDGA